MPRRRHSPEQIAAALRQAESGTPIAELARKLGVHENTIHLWKKRFGDLGTPEIRELRQLRDEKAQAPGRRPHARQDDASGRDLKKVVKPAGRRVLVGHLKDRYRVSERRACGAMRFSRESIRYKAKIAPLNDVLRQRIKEIAAARVRYGYRRVHVLLQREGWIVNHKRIRRLYRQEGLSLRARAPKRKRAAQMRQPQYTPLAPNEVWCMDFMHDRLGGIDRRPIRLLTCVDVFTRECLALEVAPGFRTDDVLNVLSKLVAKRGRPQAIRCDNGTEFTATAFDQWAYANSITIDYSRPGKPTDNAFIESFNGRVRQELLNASWFDTIEIARAATRLWRREYNEKRPHRSLGNKTPKEYAALAFERSAAEKSQ